MDSVPLKLSLAKARAHAKQKEKKSCSSCAQMRLEVAMFRDLAEELCRRLCPHLGLVPNQIRQGRPVWTFCIPEKYQSLWKFSRRVARERHEQDDQARR